MEMLKPPEELQGLVVLDRDSIKSLLGLLRLPQLRSNAFRAFGRIIRNLCSHPWSRVPLIEQLLALLPSNNGEKVTRDSSGHKRRKVLAIADDRGTEADATSHALSLMLLAVRDPRVMMYVMIDMLSAMRVLSELLIDNSSYLA